jgi:hypothetical protein
MLPLARLWTWTGQLFIPLAFGWAIYIRNGFDTAPVPDGVVISRAYAGLLLTLAAGTILSWSFALYVSLAKQYRARTLAPPNTTFEEKKDRNVVISWATVLVFAAAVIAGIIVFGASYAKSELYVWDSLDPLGPGFWSSRAAAYEQSCLKHPCFALGAQVDSANRAIYGVYEYIRYVTDGAIVVLAFCLLSGLTAVVLRLRKMSPG